MRDDDDELKELLHETQGDVASIKAFLTRALPLASGFFLAAYMYRQNADPFWLLISVLLLAATVGYLVLSIARDIIEAFHAGKAHRAVFGTAWRRMVAGMEKVADNDLLALVCVIVFPLVILLLLKTGDVYLRNRVTLRWLQGFVCLIYLAYLAVVVFVQAHRALLLVMKARNAQMRRIEERMAVMRRNDAIASQTHDTVSSGLSFIAFTAQKNIEDGVAPQRDWHDVNGAALRTLDNVHAVIGLLAAEPFPRTEESPQAPSEDGWHMIRETCALGDARLHKLRFEGVSKVSVGTGRISGDMEERISRLITELHTNIGRYADRGVPYFLAIEEKNNAIIVTQTNDIATLADDDSGNDGSMGSGNGLRLHAQWIERAGGVLNTSEEEGEWVLYASIPINGER